MLHENGNTRQFNGRSEGATIARHLTTEEAARRAAALVGEDSPLRPGMGGARPSAEFAGMLSRLSDAFGQLRSLLQGVEDKIESLQGTVQKSSAGMDTLKERVALEDARMASFHQRIARLETKQTATLEGIEGRVTELTRQVSIALTVAVVLATLSIIAIFVLR